MYQLWRRQFTIALRQAPWKKKSLQDGGWSRKNVSFNHSSLYLRTLIEHNALCRLFSLFCMRGLRTQRQDHRRHNWEKEKGKTAGPVKRETESRCNQNREVMRSYGQMGEYKLLIKCLIVMLKA